MARDREDDGLKGDLDGELSDDDSSGAQGGWMCPRPSSRMDWVCSCTSVPEQMQEAAAPCSRVMPLQSIPESMRYIGS